MKTMLALALCLVATAASAETRPASKAEREMFCESVGNFFAGFDSDTGIDVADCKKNVRPMASYVGRSLIIEIVGDVDTLHLESRWKSRCVVRSVQGNELSTQCMPVDG